MEKKLFDDVVGRLKDIITGTRYEGHAFVVGGSVRDLIMGHEIKDIDIVVSLPNGGIEFAKFMEENGHTLFDVVVYPTYGTAMFVLKDFPDVELECVQTRKEQYKDKGSRNPETAYGTIEEDCMRRDLTINALYMNICSGEILDLTGCGRSDIENHVIRTTSIPDIVFSDDPLRICRVIRFSSRYGWEIEEATKTALSEMSDRLSIITQERITDEFCKMMTCDRSVMALKLMLETGVLKYVLPELLETVDMGQNAYHFGTVWEHTLAVVDNTPNDLLLRVSALLHDIGKIRTRTVSEDGKVHFYRHEETSAEMCDEILRRMKFPTQFIRDVQFLVRNHMRTKQWGDDCSHMKLKSLRKLQYECGGIERFTNLMLLIHADNVSHASGHCLPNQVQEIIGNTAEMLEEGGHMFGYALPLTGDDIMAELGIEAGREVKEYKKYCLKLAFSNPDMGKDVMLKHLRQYRKQLRQIPKKAHRL